MVTFYKLIAGYIKQYNTTKIVLRVHKRRELFTCKKDSAIKTVLQIRIYIPRLSYNLMPRTYY